MSTEKKSMMDKILEKVDVIAGPMTKFGQIPFVRGIVNGMVAALPVTMVDRKSTRLNSSHSH